MSVASAENTRVRRWCLLAGVWVCAAIAAIVFFYFKWNKWPDGAGVMALTLVAPFALPLAFLQTLSFDNLNALHVSSGVRICVLVLYWLVLPSLQWRYAKSGSPVLLAVIVAVITCSVPNWVVFGVALFWV